MGFAQSKITSQDKVILDLKIQRDKLKQYCKRMQIVIQQELDIAKRQLQAGNQSAALLAIKKKKYQELLLSKTDQQLQTLEQLTMSIEYSLVEKQVLKGLEDGNKVLKAIHEEISLDKVQKLMDDTQDAIEYQAELDQTLSQSLSQQDELEIEQELDELIALETASKLPSIPTTNVPLQSDTVQSVQSEDQEPSLVFPSVPTSQIQEPSQTKYRQKKSEDALLA